jgi:hypothetical protein
MHLLLTANSFALGSATSITLTMQEQQSTLTIVAFINLHDATHNRSPFATATAHCPVSSMADAASSEPRKSQLSTLWPCPALTHLPARQRIGVTTPSNRLGRVPITRPVKRCLLA